MSTWSEMYDEARHREVQTKREWLKDIIHNIEKALFASDWKYDNPVFKVTVEVTDMKKPPS